VEQGNQQKDSIMKLSESELRNLIKVTHKTERTLYGICPKCGKNEFGVSLNEPHLFGCFRKKKCGFVGNIFSLLKFLGLKQIKEKKRYIGLNIQSKLEQYDLKQFEILPEVKLPIGFKRVKENEYLRSRGYTDNDFENYLCGFTNLQLKMKNRIIIGFKDGIKTVGYIARAMDTSEPRYLNKGASFSKVLDGLEESNYDEATIVEGHFDRINTRNKFRELGIESRVVSCFGAKISDYQINLLLRSGVTKVNLFFDLDVHKIIMSSSSKLIHKFSDFKIMKTTNFDLDPGDMDIIQIGESYLNRENFIKFATVKLPMIQL
jgi:ssDNA-binding Zn-finger/Zn-ribbon topoisomerase 1